MAKKQSKQDSNLEVNHQVNESVTTQNTEYQAPTLTEHGSVTELTQFNTGGIPESFNGSI